ncbi:MAG: glutamate--tRNA ligase [Dehalococcoidia bacterium]|nr:glutamate--tRNA ligase [Dehalococcoidia bacterium]
MSTEDVRVRYAPSPTGYPHIGNIRTALFNWLFARHTGGKFIVRIEDTDQSRKVEGAVEQILESLRWLGLDWDEGPEVGGPFGPYFQSERLELYRRYAHELVEAGHAYRCYCSPERLARMHTEMVGRKESVRTYDRHCRELSADEQAKAEAGGVVPVIRFKVPLAGQTTFHDLIRGDITFSNAELDDLVLLKSDGYPTYHLANVVDDHSMQVSHVMRADEWLSSTPRHVLLYKAFGWTPPLYAHLPMILGPDKSKLSKRHGATALLEYRDEGYLPEAIFNFLALLGWSLDDKTDVISREDLVRHFSLDRISRTAAVFDIKKLQWLNGFYIRKLSPSELAERALPFYERQLPQEVERPLDLRYVGQVVTLQRERVKTLAELPENAAFFFVEDLDYPAELLLKGGMSREQARELLTAAAAVLGSVVTFDAAGLEAPLRALAERTSVRTGDLFGLLRVAVTGRTAAPPLFDTMAVVGKERCLKRVRAAVRKLSDTPAA